MRIHTTLAAAAIAISLSGCYTYPVYQPVPVARLTPQQTAALANSPPMTPAQREQYVKDSAQVAQEDQASQTYAYAYPVAPVYSAPYPYYADPYYGYPYYGGYYGGLYPSISLGFGFGGYYGHGWHGGGYHGGYHGGFHGGDR